MFPSGLTGEKSFQTPYLSPAAYQEVETFQLSSVNPTNAVPQLTPSCPFTGGRSHSTGQMITPGIGLLGSSSVANAGDESTSKSATADHLEFKKLQEQLTISELSNYDYGTMSNQLFPRSPISPVNYCQSHVIQPSVSEWPISQHLFETCFPFHILFDRELRIRFIGVSLARLFPKAVINEEKLTDHLELIRPALSLTYKNIHSSIQNIFILCTKNSLNGTCPNSKDFLQFRGQMIPTSSHEGALILFLGSPRVNKIEDLEEQGLYLSDIPVHDVTRDLLLLNRHFQVEMCISKELEETRRDLQVEKARTEEEKRRADELLHAMLPHSIANELKSGLVASAMDYPAVTILFSDIKGFTNICNKCPPMLVVGMLNDLYTRFDSQLEKFSVYKVGHA